MKNIFLNFAAAGCILLLNIAYGNKIYLSGSFVKLPNDIIAAEDVSAVAKFGSLLVIGSDEGAGKSGNKNYVQLLKKNADGSYNVHNNILLFEGNENEGKEMDIEGITVEGNNVYVIGSHSSKRQKVKNKKKYKQNREKFHNGKIKNEKNRDWLYRLRINSEEKDVNKEKISLREIINKDDVLKTFSGIPGKENGINIEGISAKNGWLYIGFRGPVFRGNFVPVMKLKFENAEKIYDLLFVKLGGHGIRDMVSVSDGFLILSGPVGDGRSSYQLYHWDGRDIIPGKDRKVEDISKVHLLGEITPPEGGKAEGVAVIAEEKSLYQLIITYDGVKDKDKIMQYFSISKK